MLTSLVYFQQENVKNQKKKKMKIVNIDKENFHIYRMTWEHRTTWNFKEKCVFYNIKSH